MQDFRFPHDWFEESSILGFSKTPWPLKIKAADTCKILGIKNPSIHHKTPEDMNLQLSKCLHLSKTTTYCCIYVCVYIYTHTHIYIQGVPKNVYTFYIIMVATCSTFAQKMALIKQMLASPCDWQDSQRKWQKHGCRSSSARPLQF
jgi:hypothetical protein